MPNTINLEDWLISEQGYATGTDTTDTPAGQSMTTDPSLAPSGASGEPNIANMPPEEMAPQPGQEGEDYHSDPQYPDMPEDGQHLDFEQWKKEFYKLAIKGDVQEMKQAVMDVRNRKLDPYQRKFVEDNLQILFLREQSNIDKAGKEVRKLIKEDLDHNNPGTSLADHIVNVVNTDPQLASVFIKLEGLYGMKADPHRKYIGSLLTAIQVGSGGNTEDLIYNEKDMPPIRVSTRMNARFGDIYIGNWSLRTDDPQRYLKPPELQRLEDGSPEEKDVLRRRVEMESIAETFKNRAFLINVIGDDGTIYLLGLDMSTALKSGYTDGKLLFKNKKDTGSEAMIDDDGNITSFTDLKVQFAKETGEIDEDGKPAMRDLEFMERRQGQLFLTAQLQTLREASASFPGLVVKEIPYQGNPSDIEALQRCVPSITEILMRQCG